MQPSDHTPILSTLREDADMLELIAEFVAALQERAKSLESAANASDLEELVRLAHQLKGASGGYGFDVIGDAAALLESAGRQAVAATDVQPQLAELIILCHRASANPA